MAGLNVVRFLNNDGIDIKTRLEAVLRKYGEATEAFSNGLEQSSSNYDLMVAKQSYLLDVAGIIKRTSEIFDYQDISLSASFFEAGAWAYLDGSDRKAYSQGLDNRFTLSEDGSIFLKSRLTVRADKANRSRELYRRELLDTANPWISALRFMLDLVLELPIGSWECAACLAVSGKCENCGYGRDHGICAHPGSTYEMLCSSRESLLKNIRRSLTETGSSHNVGNLLQEQNVRFDSSDRSPFNRTEIDICGQYDIVEACD